MESKGYGVINRINNKIDKNKLLVTSYDVSIYQR